MKIRTFTNSFKVCALLAGISSLLALSARAEDLYFYPAKPWQIEQTKLSCKISSEFNNGYILSIEHQKGSIQPFLPYLSLDVRQPAFQVGQVYHAKIGLDQVAPQNIPVKALRNDAVNFSLSAAPTLSSALMNAPMLNFALEGNKFNFSLIGLSEQDPNFRSCLGVGYEQPTASVVQTPERAANALITPIAPPNKAGQIGQTALSPTNLYEQIRQQTGVDVNAPENQSLKKKTKLFPNADKKETRRASNVIAPPRKKPSHSKQEMDALQPISTGASDLDNSLLSAAETMPLLQGNDWNLEKATMRYQEAERQLKSLGKKLQKQRAQCKIEKKELEALLFDPQLTSDQQLAKLADLEDQLAQARAEKRALETRYQERLRILENQLNSY